MNTTTTGDQWPITYQWPTPPIKSKVIRTIEKWGPNGEYLGKEIITEEAWDEIPPSIPIQWEPWNPQPWNPNQPWDPIYKVTCSLNGVNLENII